MDFIVFQKGFYMTIIKKQFAIKAICFSAIILSLTAYTNAKTIYINLNETVPGDGSSELFPLNSQNDALNSSISGDIAHFIHTDESVQWENFANKGINCQTKSIEQFGITWTFDDYYTFGRYCNGDFWVVGPVNVIRISPESVTGNGTLTTTTNEGTRIIIDGRTINGSMINPVPGISSQGYDSSLNSYSVALNVGYGINQSSPLAISTGSLVSTESRVATDITHKSLINRAQILTVIQNAESVGQFRPSYCGTNKTSKFNISDIRSDMFSNILQSVTKTTNTPVLNTVISSIEKPWIDHIPGWTGRFHHPKENMMEYGRDISSVLGTAALLLHCNYTQTEKEPLLYNFLQVGIDFNGIVQNGGQWGADGGHASGRKWPIIFAGIAFNDTEMKKVAQKSGAYAYSDGYGAGNLPPDYISFGEDDQTFYVSEDDVYDFPYTKRSYHSGFVYWGHGSTANEKDYSEYTQHHLGMPEWGIRHTGTPIYDGLDWDAPYRANTCGGAWPGFVLAVRMTQYNELDESDSNWAKNIWNHNALFDYQDRYMVNQTDWQRSWSYWQSEMWDTYREGYGTETDWSIYDFSIPNKISEVFTIFETDSTVKLAWLPPEHSDNYSDTVKYHIQNEVGDIAYVQNLTNSEYTFTELIPNTEYSVAIFSVNENGNVNHAPQIASFTTKTTTNEDITAPSVPSGVNAEALDAVTVELNWDNSTDSESGIQQYIVYRNNIIFTTATSNSYIDNNVFENTSYSYKIAAVNNAGLVSGLSNQVDVTTPAVDLVVNMSFDGNILDSSGLDHTIYISAGDEAYVNGKFEQAFNCIETNAVKLLPPDDYPDIYSNTDHWTTSFWVKGNYETHDQIITALPIGFEYYGMSGNVALQFEGKRSSTLTPSQYTEWIHWAIVCDGIETRLYMNNVLDKTFDPIYIGTKSAIAFGGVFSKKLNGAVDECRFYRRALSDSEIQDLYLTNNPQTLNPPRVEEAEPTDKSNLEILFDKTVREWMSASNFFIDNGVNIGNIELLSNERSINLSTDDHEVSTTYTLTVQNIEDVDGRVMSPQSITYHYPGGLVGWWKLNQSTGIAPIESSQKSHGTATLINDPYWTGQGEIGMNGDDAIKFSTTDLNTDQGAIAIWAYANEFASSEQYILGHQDPNSNNLIQLYTNNTNGSLSLGLGNNHALATGITNLTQETWYHLALVWDQGTYTLYINDTAISTGPYTPFTELNSFIDLGNTGITNSRTNGFKGFFDELRIYKKALTAIEIADLASDTGTVTNTAPVLASISDKTIDEGENLTFNITASDIDGDPITITAANLPTDATFDGATFDWTPSFTQSASYSVSFTAFDGTAYDTETITITVQDSNRAPVMELIPEQTVNENETLTLTINANDPDGDTITTWIDEIPNGASLTNSIFTWTPNFTDAGTYIRNLYASDGELADTKSMVINVINVNTLPSLSNIGNKTIHENQLLSFSLTASDLDGDTLTYTAENTPLGSTFLGSNFSWLPDYNKAGSYEVTFNVTDTVNTDSETITITVLDLNTTPNLNSIGNKTATENTEITFSVTATDEDGDTVSIVATSLPTGAAFDGSTFRWTPQFNQEGTHNIIFTATDGNTSDSETITITVGDINTTPVLNSIGNKNTNENQPLSFTTTASDQDGDTTTITSSALPAGATFNGEIFNWNPTYNDAGVYSITFTASDGEKSDSETITITINNINTTPTLTSIGNKAIDENNPLTFNVSVSDVDGDTLTTTATGLPTGATFNGSNFAWTPDFTQAGTYNITFTTTDAGNNTDTETITITVTDINRAPDLNSVTAKSIDENQTLTFNLIATDEDNDTITISSSNLPTGATLTSNTFSWKPDYTQSGSYSVTFNSTDGSLTDQTIVSITVNNINRAPSIATITNKTIGENQLLNFNIIASDPDGETVTTSATGLPTGATLINNNFSWTPQFNQSGIFNITVTATDSLLESSETFTITVSDSDRSPEFTPINNKNINENQNITFTINATDPDGDAITYSANNLPNGAILSGNNFNWTPDYSQAGDHTITFKATNDMVTEMAVTITVTDVNTTPELLNIGNKNVNENSQLIFPVTASDEDNDTITITASNLPANATFNGTTFNWTPTYSDSGSYTVNFTATDGTNTDSEQITITVANINTTPILSAIGNKNTIENTLLTFTTSATDEDGDMVTITASGLPTGATFNNSIFTWTPDFNSEGNYAVTITATDGTNTNSETITIIVTDINTTPTLSAIGNKTIDEDSLLSFSVSAEDQDNDTLTITTSTLPTGAAFNNSIFTWNPDFNQDGTYTIKFTVTDGTNTDFEDITITVNDINRAPELDEITNKSVNENEELNFTINGSDLDGDTLTYSANSLPQGSTLTSNNFIWTPSYEQSGTYPITFTVSDGNLTDQKTLNITVSNTNRSPQISAISNKTINETETLSFNINATDPDSDSLTVTSTGFPTGASLFGSTFTFTPDNTQAGTYNITIKANDGSLETTESFSITVTNKDREPEFTTSTQAKFADENTPISFTVQAIDPDGETVTYSASNLPDGATFTGNTFSWTPTYEQAGSYAVIFTASNNLSDSITIPVIVKNINREPLLQTISNKSINENSNLTFTLNATDPDGDNLSYSMSSTPTGATLSGRTFAWKPSFQQAGNYNVTFTVNDGSAQNSKTVNITVNNLNTTPVLDNITDKSIYEGQTISFDVNASDLDGDSITITSPGKPNGSSFDGSRFIWNTQLNQAGIYTVNFIASDGTNTDTKQINITVQENTAPVFENIGIKTVSEGKMLTINVNATDEQNSLLSYTAQNIPDGAVFTNKKLIWTPNFDQQGEYEVIFNVTDGEFNISTSTTILVTDNREPSIGTLNNITTKELELTQFIISASDPDGNRLSYSIDSMPAGAQFNQNTGFFSWTPAKGQVGIYNINFSVTDGQYTSSTLMNITVEELAAPSTSIIFHPDFGRAATEDADETENENQTPETNTTQDADSGSNQTTEYTYDNYYDDSYYEDSYLIVNEPTTPDSYGYTEYSDETEYTSEPQPTEPEYETETSPDVLLSETFTDTTLNDWSLIDEANTTGKSEWAISSGALSQSSNITSPASTIDKPGTMAIYNLGDSWTNYEAKATIKSIDNDAFGLIFRYKDQNNFYRFSWDSQYSTRQLTKKVNGTTYLIAQDKSSYAPGRSYNIVARSQGSSIDILVNGSKVFSVFDDSLYYGSIGFYTWSNESVSFDNVNVTALEELEITNNAPAIEPISDRSINENSTLIFTVSASDPDNNTILIEAENLPENAEFNQGQLTWTPDHSQIGTHEITFTVSDGQYVDSALAKITVLKSNQKPEINDMEPVTVSQEELLTLKLSATDPDQDEITYSANNLPQGATLNNDTFSWTPEIGTIGIFNIEFSASDGLLSDSTNLKIDVTEKEEETILLTELFDTNYLTEWEVQDVNSISGPSQWEVVDGKLTQTSNIFDNYSKSIDRLGTYTAYKNGNLWTDYNTQITISSSDDDTIGLMFRVKDDDNYYRISWDKQFSYRRLVKKVNGEFIQLAEDAVAYESDRSYTFDIKCLGSQITITIDGQEVFNVTDSDIDSGTIAMYCWANNGSAFDNIKVTDLTESQTPTETTNETSTEE